MKTKSMKTTPALRALAESIARTLFTNSVHPHDRHVDRLEQTLADGRELGGWSERAVADKIEDALRGAAIVPLEVIARLRRTVEVLEKMLVDEGAATRNEAGEIMPAEPSARRGRHAPLRSLLDAAATARPVEMEASQQAPGSKVPD